MLEIRGFPIKRFAVETGMTIMRNRVDTLRILGINEWELAAEEQTTSDH